MMLEILKETIFLYPFIALLVITVPISLFGIFVIFKRMVFFSDAISHSAIFVIALSYLLALNLNILVIFWTFLFSILIFILKEKSKLNLDILIMLISIFGLSLGIILFNYIPYLKGDISSFLFGNILLVSKFDVLLIFLISLIAVLFIFLKLKELILIPLNEEWAITENVDVKKINFLFNILLGITIVLGIKFIGALLISAILILPASIAKLISNSFKELLIFTLFYGEMISILGFILSYILNLPLGPCIVILGFLIFSIILTFRQKFV
jgi:zinc transport system permease protein